MVRVYDEKKHAERMLIEGFLLEKKLFVELMILCKYFRSLDKKDIEIEDLLHEFCSYWLKTSYNYVKFIDLVKKVIKSTKNYTLRETNSIVYTENEINSILKAPTERQQRLLFIYLFLSKMNHNIYVNHKETEIFKMAHISCKAGERIQMNRDLFLLGLIKPTMTGGVQILCSEIVNIPPIEEKNTYSILIEEFKDPINYWYKHIGKVTITCGRCGTLVRPNSERQHYCKDCAYELKIERKRKKE